MPPSGRPKLLYTPWAWHARNGFQRWKSPCWGIPDWGNTLSIRLTYISYDVLLIIVVGKHLNMTKLRKSRCYYAIIVNEKRSYPLNSLVRNLSRARGPCDTARLQQKDAINCCQPAYGIWLLGRHAHPVRKNSNVIIFPLNSFPIWRSRHSSIIFGENRRDALERKAPAV